MSPKVTPIAERFWPHVICDIASRCWLWRGRLYPNGYGQIGAGMRGGGHLMVHRVSWTLHFGPIPDGLQVLHHCDVHACVRPDHLFLGTQKANMDDMWAKSRQSPPPPQRGEQNYGAKLTWPQVNEARAQFAAGGIGYAALGRQFGLTANGMRLLITGRTWKHHDAIAG